MASADKDFAADADHDTNDSHNTESSKHETHDDSLTSMIDAAARHTREEYSREQAIDPRLKQFSESRTFSTEVRKPDKDPNNRPAQSQGAHGGDLEGDNTQAMESEKPAETSTEAVPMIEPWVQLCLNLINPQ